MTTHWHWLNSCLLIFCSSDWVLCDLEKICDKIWFGSLWDLGFAFSDLGSEIQTVTGWKWQSNSLCSNRAFFHGQSRWQLRWVVCHHDLCLSVYGTRLMSSSHQLLNWLLSVCGSGWEDIETRGRWRRQWGWHGYIWCVELCESACYDKVLESM